MKITIYELLGLIKDGKAPKEFKYKERYFQYKDNDYWSNDIGGWFSVECLSTDNLNDEVEILDEEDEFIDIEEIKHEYLYGLTANEEKIDDRVSKFEDKINQLIKNQKKIIERLSNEVYSKH